MCRICPRYAWGGVVVSYKAGLSEEYAPLKGYSGCLFGSEHIKLASEDWILRRVILTL